MFSTTLSNSYQTPNEGESAIGVAEMVELWREFPGDGVRELVQTFSEEGSLILERMTAAVEQQDGRALARAAHALRGAGGNFGARPLDSLCQEIEKRARAGDFACSANLLVQVRQEYHRVEMALQKECERNCHG